MSGIENVVASSGTSLTTEQIKLIKRLTENVTILFDGDNAGIKASFRSIDMLLTEGMNIRVLLFPDGDDPDSFARKHPQEYVEKFIENQAMDFIDFKAEILLKEVGNDPIKKAEAIRDIVKSVSFVQNALKREVYLKEVSNKFGLSEQSLFNELDVQKQITQNQTQKAQVKADSQQPAKLQIVDEPRDQVDPIVFNVTKLENDLINHMLNYGDVVLQRSTPDEQQYEITVIEEILHHFEEDGYEFQVELNKRIVDYIKEGIEKEELRKGNFFFGLMDEELSKAAVNSMNIYSELNDWSTRNIFSPNYGDKIPEQVAGDILIHKFRYVNFLILKAKKELADYADSDEGKYFELIKKIQMLTLVSVELSKVLNYSAITGIYSDR